MSVRILPVCFCMMSTLCIRPFSILDVLNSKSDSSNILLYLSLVTVLPLCLQTAFLLQVRHDVWGILAKFTYSVRLVYTVYVQRLNILPRPDSSLCCCLDVSPQLY